MGSSAHFLKDSAAVLDYGVDWSAWLGTDTIATSTWTVPTGLTVDSETETTTLATVWLSGGTTGTTYTLVNRITTAAGRQDERTLTITVVDH